MQSRMIVLIVLVVGLVAAVVIANGVDTVVAGRLRQIAVLRLLGADARSLRESSGLVAAYVHWHLERGLRSLEYVER